MQLPTIKLFITPELNEDESVVGLYCALSFDISEVEPENVLVQLPIISGRAPSQRYEQSLAFDASGSLPLKMVEEGNLFSWYPTRVTMGRVSLQFYAKPRSVNSTTPIGSRVDMRSDHGGIGSCGLTFIPLPVTREEYGIIIHWHLTGTSTSAVWSLGDGAGPHHTVGTVDILRETYYAAGPIRKLEKNDLGFYWFGDLPNRLSHSASWAGKLLKYITQFFNDANATYRIFVRNASPASGFGGTAFQYSYCLEYDSDIESIPIEDINQLLVHEMIHSWPLIGKYSDSDQTQLGYAWYNEGIANYYSIVMPYKAGLLSDTQFVEQINDMLTSYYTHRYIHWTNKDIEKIGWKDGLAVSLPYLRGFAYLLKVSGQIGTDVFDKIINTLLRKKMKGILTTEADWLQEVHSILGDAAEVDYHHMASGKLIVPRDCIPGHALVRKDKEQLALGMSLDSFEHGQVMDLDHNSRAAHSGLMDGDRIIKNTRIWFLEAHYEAKMKIRVLREGKKQIDIEYWPRSWETVEAWEFQRASI